MTVSTTQFPNVWGYKRPVLINDHSRYNALHSIVASRPSQPPRRNALYMPIIVAKKYNPVIKTFYDRLVCSGKPKLVALIAAMRKLLTILNVMIRNGVTWKTAEINTGNT